jgi:hypothetical protein
MDLGRGSCFDSSWKNPEALCDSSLSTEHYVMTEHLTRSNCEGVKKRCIPNTRKGPADDKLWNDRKRMGMVASRKCQGYEGYDCESRQSTSNDGGESDTDLVKSS